MFLFKLVETIQALIMFAILLFLLKTAFFLGYGARENPFLVPILNLFTEEKSEEEESILDRVKDSFL